MQVGTLRSQAHSNQQDLNIMHMTDAHETNMMPIVQCGPDMHARY